MRPFVRSFVLCAALFAGLSSGLAAQEQTADEKKAEKEFNESIERELDRLTRLLDLEDWQIFYVDSILVHDYKAMQAELTDLQKQKVSNTNMYYDVQYKWMDKIYDAYGKLFDEDQWAKYLKSGAAREKKTRDKFREKQKR
ncbi:MAG: hypothetical protein IJL42_06870 [Bacteroidales bacterium]|jgi:hypothetical protein|nr:hypothetical protein [Bacteroidales bacterium]